MNSREHTGHPHTHAPHTGEDHAHHHEGHPRKPGGCCGGGGCGGHGRHEHAHDHGHEHGHDQHDESGGGCCGGSGGGGCCGGSATEREPVYVFSKRQVRELDRLAVEEYGVPSIILMENAARGIASVILEALQSIPSPTALVLCGPGNNGGDGFAVARHLHNRGVKTAIVLAAAEAKLTGDALTNFGIVRKMGIPVFDADRHTNAAFQQAVGEIGQPHIIVDALLGTGADRATGGVIAEAIRFANKTKEAGTSIIAVDVPSGLDCDTGLPIGFDEGNPPVSPGPTIQADLTIALAGVKAGYMRPEARPYVGEMVVVDIGAPLELVRKLGHPLA